MPGVKSMIMPAQEDEEEMPSQGTSMAMTRHKEEDTHRTKMLKDSLREIHDLHARAQKTMPKEAKAVPKSGASMVNSRYSNTTQLEKKRLPDVARLAADGLEAYQSVTAMDELCAELSGAPDFAPVLKDCGKRINKLCERLTAIQPPTPPDGEAGGRKATPDGVKIVARPPDEAVSMVKSRCERLALQYISENVRFAQLEDLADTVEKATAYDQLRDIFPKRHLHHPNLTFLTDHTLEDSAAFRSCVWKEVKGHIAASEQEKSAQVRASRAGFQLGNGRKNSLTGRIGSNDDARAPSNISRQQPRLNRNSSSPAMLSKTR